MGNKYGPRIIDDGLVFCLDAAGGNKTFPVDGLNVEYLVISAGGAGGGGGGGGGAGGWILGSTQTTIASGTYPIVIGAGGTGYSSNSPGTDGAISSAFGVIPSGGGGGGAMYGDNARDGGSGGGGNLQSAGGESVAGQGNNGGDGAQYTTSGWNVGGGGGGAGTVGMAAHVRGTNKAGSGGTGKYFGDKFSNNIGESGWLSGGGGGGCQAGIQNGGLAGLGGGGHGGGNGSYSFRASGQDGDANSGGGGGASNEGGQVFGKAGNGGSGIVLIRYSGPPRAKGGDSIISHNGYTIHVFNSSGNFIVGETVSDLSRTKTYATLTNMDSGDYTIGAYWSFDGSNQRLLVPHNSSQPYDLTYETVIFLNTLPCTTPGSAGCYRSIWQKSIDWNGNTGISLQFIYGFLRFSYGETWGASAYYNQSNFQANKYYHIVGTSSSTSSGTTKLYVNGALVKTGTGGTPTTTNPLWIGYGSSGGINGRIPLFKSYSIELSQEQILNNFNAVRGRYGI